MLLVLLGAVVTPSEGEDHRVAALKLAQEANGSLVIGQAVVGKRAPRHDVGTHESSTSLSYGHVANQPVRPPPAIAPVSVTGNHLDRVRTRQPTVATTTVAASGRV